MSSASMGHLTLFKQTVERLVYHLLKKAGHVVRGCIQLSQRPCKAFVVEKDSSQQLCRSVHMGNISSPVTNILVRKTGISVTGPAHLLT